MSFEEAAVGRYPLRLKEVHVEDDDKIASQLTMPVWLWISQSDHLVSAR